MSEEPAPIRPFLLSVWASHAKLEHAPTCQRQDPQNVYEQVDSDVLMD
jgi:hypothetical protein